MRIRMEVVSVTHEAHARTARLRVLHDGPPEEEQFSLVATINRFDFCITNTHDFKLFEPGVQFFLDLTPAPIGPVGHKGHAG